MAYPNSTKNECLKLFIAGIPIEQISKQYKNRPTKQTLWAWYNKYNWQATLEGSHAKIKDKLDEDLTKLTTNQHTIFNYLIAKDMAILKEKIEQGKHNPTEHDIRENAKHLLLLMGKATERVETTGFITLLDELGKKLKEKKNV